MNVAKYKPKPRLKNFDYCGRYRYFITICTDRRKNIFEENNALAQEMVEILAASGGMHGFTIWAYCFMPDHLHFLAEGRKEDSDLKKFIKDYKQKTGYRFAKQGSTNGNKLWQPGFYEHVLREMEATDDVLRYILNNPVRRGLVKHYLDYRHSGSLMMDVRNVL
ncbi:MAG: transposase [Smithella sp.]